MKTRTLLFFAPWVFFAGTGLSSVACGDAFSVADGGKGGANSTASTSDATTSSVGGGGGSSTAVTSSGTQSTSSSSGSGGDCAGASDVDNDGDGFSEDKGDCNDCRFDIGPGAMELGDGAVDEDCDGFNEPASTLCDTGIGIDEKDSDKAANAIGLCRPAEKGWGVSSTRWTLPDGADLSVLDGTQISAFHLGHGILPSFGPFVSPKEGAAMLALSTGTARRPGDTGYASPSGYDKLYDNSAPAGFPQPWPHCPGATPGAPQDGIALEVDLRVPTNVASIRYDFDFYAFDYPMYLCSDFNDFFVAIMTPGPVGIPNGNLSYDGQQNAIGVNADLLNVCVVSPASTCPFGASQLSGTGFDNLENSVASGWMRTVAPVDAGSDITLRFAIWDSADGIGDSTVLLDNFAFEHSAVAVLTTSIGP